MTGFWPSLCTTRAVKHLATITIIFAVPLTIRWFMDIPTRSLISITKDYFHDTYLLAVKSKSNKIVLRSSERFCSIPSDFWNLHPACTSSALFGKTKSSGFVFMNVYAHTLFVTVDGYPVIKREIISLSFFAVALIYYNNRIDCMSAAVWCTRARFTFFKGKLYGFVSDNSDLLYIIILYGIIHYILYRRE